MDSREQAELQLRNLSCVVPQLQAKDVPASLDVAARLREEIGACAEEHRGQLLMQLECIVGDLHKLAGGD